MKLRDLSKWEQKREYRTLTKHHKLYDYISIYVILSQTVSSTIYLKRNISVANVKELCLFTNKTHAGNYDRLLKIKTTKAQNLHFSINTINFEKSRLHIPGIMAYAFCILS